MLAGREGRSPMSLRAPLVYCLPDDTARVARAAFPKGNAYLRVYDALGPIYRNPQFAALFPKDGQPAVAPAQLALATIFQFAEGLSDRQAADAVRGRIDWKYALCLELEYPRFRRLGPERVPWPPHRQWCRGGAVRDAADRPSDGGVGQAAGPPAHGFDACAGGDPRCSTGSNWSGRRYGTR